MVKLVLPRKKIRFHTTALTCVLPCFQSVLEVIYLKDGAFVRMGHLGWATAPIQDICYLLWFPSPFLLNEMKLSIIVSLRNWWSASQKISVYSFILFLWWQTCCPLLLFFQCSCFSHCAMCILVNVFKLEQSPIFNLQESSTET